MTRKSPNPLTLIEIEDIKVFKASGLSNYAISKKLGRDSKTIKRCCQDPRNAEEIEKIKQELAGFFEDLAVRFITSVADEDIMKLNAYQRIISAGICVDKLRLLRNESTQNISVEVLQRKGEDIDRHIAELEAELGVSTGEDCNILKSESKLLENPENSTGESAADDNDDIEQSAHPPGETEVKHEN